MKRCSDYLDSFLSDYVIPQSTNPCLSQYTEFFTENIANTFKNIFWIELHAISGFICRRLFRHQFKYSFCHCPLSPCILWLSLCLSNVTIVFRVNTFDSRQPFLSPMIRLDSHAACCKSTQCLSFAVLIPVICVHFQSDY